MIALLIALQVANAAPTREALRLGRGLAEVGSFGTITRAAGAAETEELVKSIPTPTAAEQQRLRSIAAARLASVRSVALDRVGAIYARRFTLADLQAITRFYASPAGRALSRETFASLPEIAAAMNGIDFKGDVRAAFCKETRKLCSK